MNALVPFHRLSIIHRMNMSRQDKGKELEEVKGIKIHGFYPRMDIPEKMRVRGATESISITIFTQLYNWLQGTTILI